MKTFYSTILVLLICAASNAQSPFFTITVSPVTQTITQGSTAVYNITVNPFNGYAATVNLSLASAPCIAGGVSITPSSSNFPYSGIQMQVSTTAGQAVGTYTIIMQGANGPVTATDTAYLNITPTTSDWTNYVPSNSGNQLNLFSAIAVDTNGIVWAGGVPYYAGSGSCGVSTSNGTLCRYDGVNWDYFTGSTMKKFDKCGNLLSQSSGSFPNGNIHCLFVDSQNNLWVATDQGTIHKYSASGTWSLVSSSVTALCIAEAPNGDLWMGSGSGIYKYSNSTFTSIPLTQPSLICNTVWEIKVHPVTGTVYMVTGSASGSTGCDFVVYDGTFWSVYNYNNSIINNPQGLAIDGAGDVFVGNYETTPSLAIQVDKFTGTGFLQYTMVPGANSYSIWDMETDKNGVVWIGRNAMSTGGGVYKLTGTTFTSYNNTNSGFPASLCSPGYEGDVRKIAFSKNNIMWIATTGEGIVRYTGESTTTGVIEKQGNEKTISAFPNPSASGIFTVNALHFEPSSSYYEIFSLAGEKIANSKLGNDETFQVDLSSFSKGLYLLRVYDSEKSIVQKLVNK